MASLALALIRSALSVTSMTYVHILSLLLKMSLRGVEASNLLESFSVVQCRMICSTVGLFFLFTQPTGWIV